MSGKGIKRDSRGACRRIPNQPKSRYWCGTKYGWCDELRPAEKNKADVDSTSAADGFRAIVLERAVLNSKLQNADRTRAAYKTIFDSEQFSDITVVIGDREAKLHKCVLSGCEYFERMLSTEFKEATAKVVKLEVAEGSSAEATLLAIEYIYSGYVDFHQHSDSVMEVLAAADKLQLTHLRDVCVEYLDDNLCAENVCTVFSASRHLGLQKLEKQCLRFLLREGWEGAFSALRRPNGIEQLPKETLLSMLEGDDLNVDEEVVFTALVRWCEENKERGRALFKEGVEDEFAAFLPFVRFAAMSHVFLYQVVEPSGLVPPKVVIQALAAQLDVRGYLGRALEGAEGSCTNTERRSTDYPSLSEN
jgi:hypothetical protein